MSNSQVINLDVITKFEKKEDLDIWFWTIQNKVFALSFSKKELRDILFDKILFAYKENESVVYLNY